MAKKRIVIAVGHKDLGTNLPEQKAAVAKTAKVIADFIQDGWQVAIVHSNAPQVGMIHTAMNEFGKQHDGYSKAPMSVCSAMSQGYIGYDMQNGIRAELIKRGIYKPVSTVLTQVTVDPYDEAFYTPLKTIGRVMTEAEAREEEQKGNHVVEVEGGFRRIVASPHPVAIVEIDAIKALLDADQIVVACGGGGKSPVWRQMLADLYNCTVRTVAMDEGPALGAAILAGVGCGIYPDVETACGRIIREKSSTEPVEEEAAVYAGYHRIYQNLYRSLKDGFKDLAGMKG